MQIQEYIVFELPFLWMRTHSSKKKNMCNNCNKFISLYNYVSDIIIMNVIDIILYM